MHDHFLLVRASAADDDSPAAGAEADSSAVADLVALPNLSTKPSVRLYI